MSYNDDEFKVDGGEEDDLDLDADLDSHDPLDDDLADLNDDDDALDEGFAGLDGAEY